MANIDLYMQKLTNIADAIRRKLSESNQYTLEQMPGKIDSIPTGGSSVIVSKTITSNGTYNASSDSADGYNPVTVNVPSIQPVIKSKMIITNGTYIASSDNADGYSPVVVSVPAPTLITKNISANGTYNASSDLADGYSSVVVNVQSSGGTCGLVLDGFEVVTPTPTEV